MNVLSVSDITVRASGYSGPYSARGTVTKLGIPGPYVVRLFVRARNLLYRNAVSNAAGEYSFDFLPANNSEYFVVAFDRNSDMPLNASIRDHVYATPMDETGPAWDLPMLEGQVISGQAIGPAGVAADLVSIRDWESKAAMANIVPESDGSWTVTLPNGSYDITYFADGCAPVCHGPYVIDAG